MTQPDDIPVEVDDEGRPASTQSRSTRRASQKRMRPIWSSRRRPSPSRTTTSIA